MASSKDQAGSGRSALPEALVSKVLPAPSYRYSQVVRTGPYYHLSGMIAMDRETRRLVDGGAGQEATRILHNLQLLLAELEMSLRNLVQARIYVRDFDTFPDINAAWEQVFDDSFPPPARTSIGVSALPAGAAVEMEFILYKA